MSCSSIFLREIYLFLFRSSLRSPLLCCSWVRRWSLAPQYWPQNQCIFIWSLPKFYCWGLYLRLKGRDAFSEGRERVQSFSFGLSEGIWFCILSLILKKKLFLYPVRCRPTPSHPSARLFFCRSTAQVQCHLCSCLSFHRACRNLWTALIGLPWRCRTLCQLFRFQTKQSTQPLLGYLRLSSIL